MPELPEVENVASALGGVLEGRQLIGARLLRPKLAPSLSPRQFSARLRSTTVTGVSRRGKHILVGFSNGLTLIVHLRMTGRFSILAAEAELPKFTHAVFFLDNDERLVFRDQRHFGMMKLARTDSVFEEKELNHLAPEPFSEKFSTEYLRSKLSRTKRSIKEFLLDQTMVCGVGNIYASEVLFRSRLDPRTPACDVSSSKAEMLRDTIRDVLDAAIATVKSAPQNSEYIGEGGYEAGHEDTWDVYGREGEKCRRCKRSRIVRIVQAGRSTFMCGRCQRSRR